MPHETTPHHLRNGHGEPLLHTDFLTHLTDNTRLIEEWIAEHPLIQFRPPEATYLAWLDCRELGLGDRELREFFVHKAGLGLSPGLSFGKEGSGFMRLNFAVPTSVLGDALDRLDKALND